jgi:Na+/proline symporter
VSITQDESSDYLAKRTLKRGSAGWLLLAAAFWCLVVFAAFMAYFGLYSRRHLVANSPDEEFAALAAAEEELE